jgi:BlaI family transcriptional regulator, penicillinase repressor
VSRPGTQALTEREAQIMEILWSQGPAAAERVREYLPDRPHDSTVRTMLRILESKGYVARVGPGRPLVYEAVCSRAKAQRTALRAILARLFGGSPEALAMRLLEDRHLTPEQFEEIVRRATSTSTASRKNSRSTSQQKTKDRKHHEPGESQ